jgi:hypothetical protein
MARDSFASTYQCTSGDVERWGSDIVLDAYEVRGCGKALIYECSTSLTDNGYPDCTPETDWCTQPGCMTDDPKAAIAQFSTDASCPLDRVTTQRIPDPARPSPEIAGDPSRLVIWQQQEQTRTQHRNFIAVHGCDIDAQYDCFNNPPALPACSRVTDVSAGSAAPRAGSGSNAAPQ